MLLPALWVEARVPRYDNANPGPAGTPAHSSREVLACERKMKRLAPVGRYPLPTERSNG